MPMHLQPRERTLAQLKQKEFDIEDIVSSMKNDTESEKEIKNAGIGLFEAAKTWGIFAKKYEKKTEVKDLVSAGKTSVLDLSVYNSVGSFNVRALVISLVSRKIFNQRMFMRKKEESKPFFVSLPRKFIMMIIYRKEFLLMRNLHWMSWK